MSAEAFDELVENFDLFDDWEERYRYVIDLGKQMPEFPEALKTDATLVEGCVSRVWLDESVTGSGPEAVIAFTGDSDCFPGRRPKPFLMPMCRGSCRALICRRI